MLVLLGSVGGTPQYGPLVIYMGGTVSYQWFAEVFLVGH